MPKPKKPEKAAGSVTRRIVETVAPPEDQPEDGDPTELDQVLSELGTSEGWLVVYRKRPGKSIWDRVRRVNVQEFNLDSIPEEYGGGDYKFCLYDQGKFVSSYFHSFDPRLKGTLDKIEAGQGGTSGDLVSSLVLMNTKAEERFQALFTTLLTVVQGKQPSEDDVIKKLAVYKEMFGGGGGQNSAVMAEMFRAGIELARETVSAAEPGAAAGGGPLDTMLNRLVEKLMDLGLGKVLAGKTPQIEKKPEEGQPMTLLDQYVPGLIEKAKAGKDPSVYSAYLIAEIQPGFYPQALAWLEAPGTMDDIMKRFPAALPFKMWFLELQGLAVDELKEFLQVPSGSPVPVGAPTLDSSINGAPQGEVVS